MPAGKLYAYKVKAFGEVAELLPVDPGCVVPKLNSSWEPVYQVTFPDGSTDVLSQEDIWHVRTLTLDGLVGLNPSPMPVRQYRWQLRPKSTGPDCSAMAR